MQKPTEGFPTEILNQEEKPSLEFKPTDWTEDFKDPVYFSVIETDTEDPDKDFAEVIFFRDFCEEWEEISSAAGDFFAGTIVRKGDGYELEIDQWYDAGGNFKMQVDYFDAVACVKAYYNAWKIFRAEPNPNG